MLKYNKTRWHHEILSYFCYSTGHPPRIRTRKHVSCGSVFVPATGTTSKKSIWREGGSVRKSWTGSGNCLIPMEATLSPGPCSKRVNKTALAWKDVLPEGTSKLTTVFIYSIGSKIARHRGYCQPAKECDIGSQGVRERDGETGHALQLALDLFCNHRLLGRVRCWCSAVCRRSVFGKT